MLAIDRKQQLLAILRQRRSATLESLSAELGVSGSTVRRDIESLESTGDVERTHGGVVWTGGDNDGRAYAFNKRLVVNAESKKRIGRAARTLVRPGQTILIDGGTTTLYFAEAIRELQLQIVTNSLPIAQLYQDDENVELIVTGGLAYPRYGVLLGPITEHALSTIHPQTLFISVAGLHDGVLYNQNLLLVQAEERMIRQSQQVVLLLDHTKIGQQALSRLCDLSEVDVIVTDAPPDDATERMLQKAGSQVIVA